MAMDDLRHVLHKFQQQLFSRPHVVGVGVGYKHTGGQRTGKEAIIVFVEKKVSPRGLGRGQLVPRQLDGVETDVIEIGTVRLLDQRTEKSRPARPGMSIGHYRITAGTFGAVVKDGRSGERLILSNNHILANATSGFDGRAMIGDPILQPGPYDGGTAADRIATLVRFVPLLREAEESQCPVAAGVARGGNLLLRAVRPHYRMKFIRLSRGQNVIDAALARPLSPDLIDDNILEVGQVQGTASVAAGQKVLKSGRTSGLTQGSVAAVGVTLKVQMGEKDVAWFTEQVVGDLKSRGGDSGSLVLNEDKQAVGLLFAGSDSHTIFNQINNVLTRLEIRLL
ncbi:MAG: hypothetical protein ACUVTU_12385 [Desulfurispora sp.]|uniref:hypothetical protein n=1 Tax=Desulfurispora sp. TaxID=3014275 RepID=UPI00404AD8B6